jgi:mannan endo-1,4-beta-mannosidase
MIKKVLKLSMVMLLVAMTFTALSAFAADKKYEAEDATLTGITAATTAETQMLNDVAVTGFSGTGYVFMEGEGSVEFTVNIATAGTYEVVLGYQVPKDFGNKNQDIIVNGGEPIYNFVFNENRAFGEISLGEHALNAGANSIKIQKNWGYTMFDYLTVVGAGGADENPETGDFGVAYYALAALLATGAVFAVRKFQKN